MLCKMKTTLLVLLLLRDSFAIPTIEDNKIPTDQEILGQPEEVASLGLPSDEESFNRLSVFFNPGKVSSPQVGSGTYHFVSSTFPVDARGFHESVFDGIGDYFPSWPAAYKRSNDYPFSPTLAQRLGLQPHNRFRKRSQPNPDPSGPRNKRVVNLSNHTKSNIETRSQSNNSEAWRTHQRLFEEKENDYNKHLAKREVHPREDVEGDGVYEKNKPWINLNKEFVDGSSQEGPYDVNKRSGARHGRGMEMGSSGFHGDIFSRDFGDFTTMRKRLKGSLGFHGDTFSGGFGDFETMKRSLKNEKLISNLKDYLWNFPDSKDETSYNPNLIPYPNEEPYSEGDDEINAMKKRKPEMTSMGFHGDTFNGGFGDFYTVKKRRPATGSMGFHGDTFSQGFGDFSTLKKRPASGSLGFHGDTASQRFGDYVAYKKRRPNGGSMGFHGDTFSQGFGDFDTYKKRRPNGGSMGFHGDTFSQGFGDFDTYKKRRPNGGSMGFHGDTFSQGFGDFDTYKKRRPEMDSMGFHGDTFSRGFGEFDPLKKRRPEMDSMGFHGDTFTRGFGDFDVYKKGGAPSPLQRDIYSGDSEGGKTEGKKCCSDSSIQRHQDAH